MQAADREPDTKQGSSRWILLAIGVFAVLICVLFWQISEENGRRTQAGGDEKSATTPDKSAAAADEGLPPEPPPDAQMLRTALLGSPEPTEDTGADVEMEARPSASEGLTLDLRKEILPWEKQIEGIVARTDLDNTTKARMLIQSLSALPAEGGAAALEAALLRLPSADFGLANPVLQNPQTHASLLSVLFEDLAQRPLSISLPAYLAVAQTPDHPFGPSALDNLDHFVGENYGNNWAAWQVAVEKKILASEKK